MVSASFCHDYDWLGFLEKRLPPAERARAQAHLAACFECRAALVEMSELTKALAAMPVALQKLPWRRERLWPAVWERVRNPRMGRAHPTWQLALSMSLAIVFFALSGLGPRFVTGRILPVGLNALRTPSLIATVQVDASANASHLTATQSQMFVTSMPLPMPIPTPVPAPNG